MASEIRVDTSKNASGLCTVTYSNTGAVLSGITTGTFSGDITGDITGDVTGNMSGGSVSATTGAFSSDVVLTQDPQGFVDDSAQPQASFLIKHGTSGTNRRWVGIGASLTGAWLQSSSPGGSGLAAPFWINKGGGEVRFGTYGTKLFIKNASAATVGIGTDDPDASLEIYKGSAGTYLKAGGDNGNNGRALTFTSSATINSVDGGKHTINASSAHGELALATTGTDRLRIDKSGRLLYGTTSSTRETSLVLVGNSNSYATNPGTLDLFTGNTPSNLGSMGQICFGTQNVVGARIDGRADQDWTVNSARGTHLRFLTCDNGTTTLDERMRITNAGIIQCGTSGVLKAEINNAVSGHQFISQCDDNNNGFEVYQQHGSTATRNTLAVYDNRGSSASKQLAFAVIGDGNVSVPHGNLVFGNDCGINFAAADDTATGETTTSSMFDDYEEGTWTPYFGTSGALQLTATYTTQTGTYTKVGNLVFVMFDLVVSNTPSGATGYPLISGLPYAPLTGQSTQGGFPVPSFRSMSAAPADMRAYGTDSYGHNTHSSIWIAYYNSSGVTQQPSGGTFWTSGRITGNLTYRTAA